MNEKEKYCDAEICVVSIAASDVITTSPIGDSDSGLDKDAWA